MGYVNTKYEICPQPNPTVMKNINLSKYDMCFTTDMMQVSKALQYFIPKLKKLNEIHIWLLDENDKNTYPPLHAHHIHLNGQVER